MTRICIELLGKECAKCIETTSDCVKLGEIIAKFKQECGLIDPEHIVVFIDDSIVDENTEICGDRVIKIVRILRGG